MLPTLPQWQQLVPPLNRTPLSIFCPPPASLDADGRSWSVPRQRVSPPLCIRCHTAYVAHVPKPPNRGQPSSPALQPPPLRARCKAREATGGAISGEGGHPHALHAVHNPDRLLKLLRPSSKNAAAVRGCEKERQRLGCSNRCAAQRSGAALQEQTGEGDSAGRSDQGRQ